MDTSHFRHKQIINKNIRYILIKLGKTTSTTIYIKKKKPKQLSTKNPTKTMEKITNSISRHTKNYTSHTTQ
jgi:hypothetical protein